MSPGRLWVCVLFLRKSPQLSLTHGWQAGRQAGWLLQATASLGQRGLRAGRGTALAPPRLPGAHSLPLGAILEPPSLASCFSPT